MTDYKAERATERKAVKAAMTAAGFKASVKHGRGTASTWIDVEIQDVCRETGLSRRLADLAAKACGRDSRPEDQRNILVTFEGGFDAPLPEAEDGPKFCPDCERLQQFANLCASCLADRRAEREDREDYGGAFDGFMVMSDADGGL